MGRVLQQGDQQRGGAEEGDLALAVGRTAEVVEAAGGGGPDREDVGEEQIVHDTNAAEKQTAARVLSQKRPEGSDLRQFTADPGQQLRDQSGPEAGDDALLSPHQRDDRLAQPDHLSQGGDVSNGGRWW